MSTTWATACVIVATDRISAFDWVLPTGIPDKGRSPHRLDAFWLELLGVPNHVLGDRHRAMGLPFAARPEELAGRDDAGPQDEVVPVECVARGYLAGSGLEGVPPAAEPSAASRWPPGCAVSAASRADLHAGDQGGERARHQHLLRADGRDRRRRHRPRSCAGGASTSTAGRREHARSRGHPHRRHEVRMGLALPWRADPHRRSADARQFAFLAADSVCPRARAQPSFDKQFVRDWLETTELGQEQPAARTARRRRGTYHAKIRQAFERLSGSNHVRASSQ